MKIKLLLKWYLRILSIYLIGDGLLHVLGTKLIEVKNWSEAAFTYSQYTSVLFGLFTVLVGSFGIEASRDLNKYRNFLYIVGIWSIGCGIYLTYLGLTVDFNNLFANSPSIYVWIPFYNYYLIFEAVLCLILAVLVYLFKGQPK